MHRSFIALLLVVALLFSPLATYAATLTPAQINAVISVLTSFGADSATVAAVKAALEGKPVSTSTGTTTSFDCPSITRTLSFGSSDTTTEGQVSELQKFLGITPTGYFGLETREAVQAFQAAQGVVSTGTPATTGYGVVGVKTRAAIQNICGFLTLSDKATSNASSTPSGTPSSAASTQLAALSPAIHTNLNDPESPNARYLRDAVQRVGQKQGYTQQQLARFDEVLVEHIATTTDYRAKFYEQWYGLSYGNPKISPLAELMKKASSFLFSSLGFPTEAWAIGAIEDFGGALYFPVWCDCSETFLLAVQPLPPLYPVLLTYKEGQQLHLCNNIPITTELLGKFIPLVPECTFTVEDCAPFPTEGSITPVVGSNLCPA